MKRNDLIFLIPILLIALLLRLDLLFANNFVIDSDEAIVGLMAKHILDGQPVPTFYYGQHYMGSFEPILVAVLFSLVGVSSVMLKCVPLFFSLVFITLVYRIGVALGSYTVARLAALFAAVPPSTLVVWSTKARGGFIEILCIGALALLFTIHWVQAEKRTILSTAFIGFILGFGWWVNNQIIYYMLPIGMVMALAEFSDNKHPVLQRFSRVVRHFFAGVVAFLIGGAPYWLYNFKKDWISLEMFGRASSGDLGGHVAGFFETAVPILLGARRFWQTEDLFAYASPLVAVLYLSLFLIFLVSQRKAIGAFFLGRIDRRAPYELLTLFLLTCIAVFCMSSFGALSKAPRYLLPLYVGLFIILARAIEIVGKRNRIVAGVFVVAVLAINLFSNYPGRRVLPGEPFVYRGQRAAKDHTTLISWLDNHEYTLVRTNYWIGYRLAFETQERILFHVTYKPQQIRIPGYQQLHPEQRYKIPMVLVPRQAVIVTRGLDVLGYQYQQERVGDYQVVHQIRPKVEPESLVKLQSDLLNIAASQNQQLARQAIDGDTETRWGSGTHQQPGMQVVVSPKQPLAIRGLRYDLAKWRHDFPRDLSIQLELENGEVEDLIGPDDYQAVRYLIEDGTEVMFYTDPKPVRRIRLVQNGQDPVFDWSIAELEVFG